MMDKFSIDLNILVSSKKIIHLDIKQNKHTK